MTLRDLNLRRAVLADVEGLTELMRQSVLGLSGG